MVKNNKIVKYKTEICETDDFINVVYGEYGYFGVDLKILSESPTTGHGEKLYNAATRIAKDIAEEGGKIFSLEGRWLNYLHEN